MSQAALIVITSYLKPNLGAVIGDHNRPGSKTESAVYLTMMSHGTRKKASRQCRGTCAYAKPFCGGSSQRDMGP